MEMEKEIDLLELPIIDWDLGDKLAGGKREISSDLLALLIETLPKEIAAIKQWQTGKDYPKLLAAIHKLHGALCYCGTPRLKRAIASLELHLKNNIMFSSVLFDQLYIEVDRLLDQYAKLR